MTAPIVAVVAAGLAGIAEPAASVAAARALAGDGGRVRALVTGGDAAAVTDAAVARALDAGADEVVVIEHPRLAGGAGTDEVVALVAAALAPGAPDALGATDLVLLPAGGGEEVAARLAARLGGVPLGRCERIGRDRDGLRAWRPAYGGRATVEVATARGPWFATMRAAAGARPPAAGRAQAAEVRRVRSDAALPGRAVRVAADPAAGRRRPVLEGARVVVSGGRGIGGADGFVLLERLADALGGSVGASLPAVDSGWLPVAHQVGQSGTFVTPEVYVAVAISGTPQHLAGIGPDTRIVAVNTDADADVFGVAEVGAVADWRALLPALIERLERDATHPGETT